MKNLQNVKAKLVFEYFEAISRIPRGSGNEKAISDYLRKFAEGLNLEVIQDDALNIIIKKPASAGYENTPTVIIQGHMDMVCEKNNDKTHDFTKDPLTLRVEGDYIYADKTTLGADDGIALAYAMAILTDDSINHPALEVLLTTDEETGMTGAMGVKKEDLSGRMLINIDTEDEGYLLVSCAGGVRTRSIIKLQKESLQNKNIFKIHLKGLKGGHSGSDIDKQRGNANKILGRVLKNLSDNMKFDLIDISGGSKNNAIPRESYAIIAVEDIEKLEKLIKDYSTILRNEYKIQDDGINLYVEKSNKVFDKKISKECASSIIDLLYLYPNGINTMSNTIEGLVESSTNIGVVKTSEDFIEFDSAVRSSVKSIVNDIVLKIKTMTEAFNGKFSATDGYPAWEYNEKSYLRELCKKVYKDMYSKDINVYAIHAGVECGLFEERIGKLDMVSFGPDIKDAHTPDEHLSISSTGRVYEYLLEVLKNIK